jgi:hypothetical protein
MRHHLFGKDHPMPERELGCGTLSKHSDALRHMRARAAARCDRDTTAECPPFVSIHALAFVLAFLWKKHRIGRSFSPLAELLPERTTPELLYLEAKFAGLASYGLSAKLLAELLPLGRSLEASAVRRHL